MTMCGCLFCCVRTRQFLPCVSSVLQFLQIWFLYSGGMGIFAAMAIFLAVFM